MIRTTALVLAGSLLLVGGCLDYVPATTAAPVQPPTPKLEAACEALRPAFPISYAWPGDTRETVDQVRAANARFAAACP